MIMKNQKKINLKSFIGIGIIAMTSATSNAQESGLYDHTTPIEPYIIQYRNDLQAINYFYGPMPKGWGFQYAAASPEQMDRLLLLDQEYEKKMKQFDYKKLNTNGQVDYILLNRKIKKNIEDLKSNQSAYNRVKNYLPFADSILEFEKKRRRGGAVDAKEVATTFEKASAQVDQEIKKLEGVKSIPSADVEYLENIIASLKLRLESSFDFYNGYEPMFTWWVPKSHDRLQEKLKEYKELIAAKTDLKPFDDGSNIAGKRVGKDVLNKMLKDEMISYNADELLKIADKEWQWCVAELLKASKEMGFGEDWKKAQEKVKNSYVPEGKQPELINELYDKAMNFINEKQLIDIPPLADETWGMIMMTPERQLVNPFFTGGREISISYPTNTMTYDQKMMSMRGNNPHFSLGTVQHELIPGHHLQYFMNRRHKPYREQNFNTPFWTEGWTLYWELLLYRMGFPKTPEERIGMLFWRMHRCARITFSIKFHIGEWTPQQCIDYLVDQVGHEPANAHGEVKRSFEGSYDPLYQLAYMIGGLQLLSISDEMVGSGKMTYKEFHDRVIKENYMPMEMLRAILTNQNLNPDHQSSWKFYKF
ncbi:X-Pro dipeptidyl-peptidase [Sphingobacterium mizutaii NBRC 14946 = DSM 11724]|nr:X-Pro dipeptidyl-peptidase [Sphingobacterium mizutaii NBRC 14946 = DSM 11724]